MSHVSIVLPARPAGRLDIKCQMIPHKSALRHSNHSLRFHTKSLQRSSFSASSNKPSTIHTTTSITGTYPLPEMSLSMWDGLLDYDNCTPAELRDFIRSRTNLSSSKLKALKKAHKPYLVSRLRKLDRRATFRFLDLAPEIRLHVYGYILVAGGSQYTRTRDIEPNILRTCKLIYNEADPVMYCNNEFAVSINVDLDEGDEGEGEGNHESEEARENGLFCQSAHVTRITTPGRLEQYSYSQDYYAYPALSEETVACQCLFLLRRLRHLTLHLGECTYGLQKATARLCLLLSGASQLKKVTIVPHQRLTTLDTKALAKIMSAVAILNADVELEFAEGFEALEATLDEYRKTLQTYPYRTLEAPGDLIVKARMRSGRLIKEQHKDWRYQINTGSLPDEVLRFTGDIETFEGCRDFTNAWKYLQSYVNEDDKNLRLLEEVSDDPDSFPRQYAKYRRLA
jgi:hypothetical protein